jgi:hypothetical protein
MPHVSRPLRERLIDVEDIEKDRARGRAQRDVAPRRSLARLVPSIKRSTTSTSSRPPAKAGEIPVADDPFR